MCVSLYIHISTETTPFIPLTYSIKMQFPQKMNIFKVSEIRRCKPANTEHFWYYKPRRKGKIKSSVQPKKPIVVQKLEEQPCSKWMKTTESMPKDAGDSVL